MMRRCKLQMPDMSCRQLTLCATHGEDGSVLEAAMNAVPTPSLVNWVGSVVKRLTHDDARFVTELGSETPCAHQMDHECGFFFETHKKLGVLVSNDPRTIVREETWMSTDDDDDEPQSDVPAKNIQKNNDRIHVDSFLLCCFLMPS